MLAILMIAVLAALWSKSAGKIDNRQGTAIGIGILGLLVTRSMPLVGIAMIGAAGAIAMLKPRRRARAEPIATPVDVDEASALLGVPTDADENAIRAAHRRLIALAHPDKGGTVGLASRINAARDVLLQRNTDIMRP